MEQKEKALSLLDRQTGSDAAADRFPPARYYAARAEQSLATANGECLSNRKGIHLEAAKRWTLLATQASFVEKCRSARDPAA